MIDLQRRIGPCVSDRLRRIWPSWRCYIGEDEDAAVSAIERAFQ